jgi:hypothetical protein
MSGRLNLLIQVPDYRSTKTLRGRRSTLVTIMWKQNDENSRSLSKPLNIGTHCEALETRFQMVPLAFWLIARPTGWNGSFAGSWVYGPLQVKVCWTQRIVLSDICRAGPRLQSLTSLHHWHQFLRYHLLRKWFHRHFYKNEEKKSSVQTTKLKYPSYLSDFSWTRCILVPNHHSRHYFCDISILTPGGVKKYNYLETH